MQTPRRALVVSVHDVSPLTWDLVSSMVGDLAEVGVDRAALLVIPNHHNKARLEANPKFCEWVRKAAQVHEVVLHGYFHMRPASISWWWQTLVTEHYTAGEGEFYDLSEAEATDRLERARRELGAAGLSSRGFIAPAWLLGREAEQAVKNAGFDYTTRLRNFKDLLTGRETATQSLVWSVRSAWRRILSICWNPLLARQLTGAQLMRVGLHPVDWQHPSIRGQAMQLIRAALAGREVITYDGWLARLRSKR